MLCIEALELSVNPTLYVEFEVFATRAIGLAKVGDLVISLQIPKPVVSVYPVGSTIPPDSLVAR